MQGLALISNTVLNIIKLKMQPTAPNTFIMDLFSAYLTSISWDALPCLPVCQNIDILQGKCLCRRIFFQWSQKNCLTSKTLWMCCGRPRCFFVMIKNKLILLHCKHTSLLGKKRYYHHVSFVVLGLLQSMACNLPSSSSLSKYWYSFRNFFFLTENIF